MSSRTDAPIAQSAHASLLAVIRRVRRRWRLKMAFRGTAIALGAGAMIFLLSALGLERLGFGPGAIIVFRAITYAALLAFVFWFLLRPLFRRVPDERVALYLEEHQPGLQATLLSAVELGSPTRAGAQATSSALLHRVVESALDVCHAADDGRAIDRRDLRRSGMILGGAAAATSLLLLFGPAPIRSGAAILATPWTPPEAAGVGRVIVEPGNATLPRGADQLITARLIGIESPAEIVLRSGQDSPFDRLSMRQPELEAAHDFEFLLFGVTGDTEYYVEAGGIRSEVFRIRIAELPFLQNLALQFRYPAYTGLEPETFDPGGDIAAPAGTRVSLQATTTLPVAGGRIVFDDGRTGTLTLNEDGSLRGDLQVERRGYYHLELQAEDGQSAVGSPRFAIDVLPDRPPTVSFVRPRRDVRVTAIEEVFVEARANDDYGIASLSLHFSVNGGPERTVQLFTGSTERRTEISAGHTFYLDEFELEPGDIVTYYARTLDNNNVTGAQTAASDIYFIEIRPFSREYRQAEQRGGEPPPERDEREQDEAEREEGEASPGELSRRQREIIAATFNIQRDRERLSDQEFDENMTTLVQAQERLREQVGTLVERMTSRQVAQIDSAFQRIIELLPIAANEMDAAATHLRGGDAQAALPPEQRALQNLLRAEAVFREVEVSFQQQQQGGGGAQQAQQSQTARDLADLFELELDRLRNQYETVQRQQQTAAAQIEEEADRLRELARRQQQELERARRLTGAPPNMAGGGGGNESQRSLADEAEEAARRLERLARENPNPELEEAARRLREAADAMRRSANDPGSVADRAAALDRIRDASRRLDNSRTANLQRDVDEARRRAEELAAAQRRIEDGVQGLSNITDTAQREEQVRRLQERKDELATSVSGMERQLDRLAADARREQESAAARSLAEAASAVREDRTVDRIRFSRAVLDGRNPEAGRFFEEQIRADLDAMRERVAAAATSLGRVSDRQQVEEGLDRARDLVRGLESLDARIRDRAEEATTRRLAAAGQQQGQQTGQQQADQQDQQQTGQQQGQQTGQQQGQQQADQQGQQAGDRQRGADEITDSRSGLPPTDGGGAGDSRPGQPPFTPEDIRQFRGEYAQRLSEADALRRALSAAGQPVTDLDRMVAIMRRLEDPNSYGELRQMAELQGELLEVSRRFEFALRRQIAGDAERLFLTGSDEVPPGYRSLVEEYFRALTQRR